MQPVSVRHSSSWVPQLLHKQAPHAPGKVCSQFHALLPPVLEAPPVFALPPLPEDPPVPPVPVPPVPPPPSQLAPHWGTAATQSSSHSVWQQYSSRSQTQLEMLGWLHEGPFCTAQQLPGSRTPPAAPVPSLAPLPPLPTEPPLPTAPPLPFAQAAKQRESA